MEPEMVTCDVKISVPATTVPELIELMKENLVILSGTFCHEHKQGVWIFSVKGTEPDPMCVLNSLIHVSESITAQAPPDFFEGVSNEN